MPVKLGYGSAAKKKYACRCVVKRMYEAKKSCRLSGERPLMSVRNQLTIATKKTPIDQMTSQIQSGIERSRRKPTVSRER